jgi:hypothetical protein
MTTRIAQACVTTAQRCLPIAAKNARMLHVAKEIDKAKECLKIYNDAKKNPNHAQIKREQADKLAELADTCFNRLDFDPATDIFRMLRKVDEQHPSLPTLTLAAKYKHEPLPGF